MNSFEKFQRFLFTVLLCAGFFYGGYYFGHRGYLIEVRKNPPKVTFINQNPADQTVDFALFWKVWDMVTEEFLLRPVDSQKMMYGAIQGMVASLDDPYTAFLAPKINEVVNDTLHGNYQGIGAELGIKDAQLIIIAPIDGSPAKAAGVKAGDKILQIAGEPTLGITVSEAVSKIRGPAGSPIELTLQTGDEEARAVTIVRDVINLPSMSWEDKGDGTAYIRISRFYGPEANKDWDKLVSEINVKMRELDAIVVDLRDNPGGYMQTSVYMAEEFFNNKPVLYQENAVGKQEVFKADRVGSFENVPQVYVLINGGSASASEILAGALQENVGAIIVGTKSFGKGTIQTALDFEDGSGIHITIAKWLTPEKNWVGNGSSDAVGLEPDVIVEMSAEDRNEGRDPQLERALELAKEI